MKPIRLIIAALSFCTAMLAQAQSLAPDLARIAAMPAAPPLKHEDLSRRSTLREVRLAPDGKYIAFIDTAGNSNSVHLYDVATRTSRRLIPSITRAFLYWSTDSQALFIYTQDAVSAFSIKDGTSSILAKLDPKLEQKFVMVDPSQPHHVLVEQFDKTTYTLTRLGSDGSRTVLHENSRKVRQVLMGQGGQVEFIKVQDPAYHWQVMKRDGKEWREAARCERRSVCNLVSSSPDLRRLYLITTPDANRSALLEIDTSTGKQRTLQADPAQVADLDQVLAHPVSGEPQFAIINAPVLHQLGLTAAAKRAVSDVERKFTDSQALIEPGDNTPLMLLSERSARMSHERYWLYDSTRRTFDEVLQAEREAGKPLPIAHTAPTLAVNYRATDGTTVYGYLTLPPGKNLAKVPLLVMAHGGPWGRFNDNYNSLVQVVANRGVAVFRSNFRASSGHGLRYMSAPGSNLGNGLAQTDLIDGVRWLLANGVGDRKRMAIMGDSYGGYATLMALSHTPDLFQFGMAQAPPTDFSRILRDSTGMMGDRPFALAFQDRGIDMNDATAMEALAAASPAKLVAKLERPVLIMAGAKDPIVPVAGITDYVARLQEAKKQVSLLIDPEESHSLRKPISQQAYLYLLERLMHRYLGTAAPEAPSKELATYLEQHMKVTNALPGA
jgi:dienelactone hydrolase